MTAAPDTGAVVFVPGGAAAPLHVPTVAEVRAILARSPSLAYEIEPDHGRGVLAVAVPATGDDVDPDAAGELAEAVIDLARLAGWFVSWSGHGVDPVLIAVRPDPEAWPTTPAPDQTRRERLQTIWNSLAVAYGGISRISARVYGEAVAANLPFGMPGGVADPLGLIREGWAVWLAAHEITFRFDYYEAEADDRHAFALAVFDAAVRCGGGGFDRPGSYDGFADD